MTKHNSADGSYVMVKGNSIPPCTFINFSDDTPGFTDVEILNTVRYIEPDAPDSFLREMGMLENANNVIRSTGMKCRIAIWPDKVRAVLFFSPSQSKPQKHQLLRAYRNARHAMRASEFHEMNVAGEGA